MATGDVLVESIHGGTNDLRSIYYSYEDSQGVLHSYGPVQTTDPNFDIEAHKSMVAAKVAEDLAEMEFRNLAEG